MRIRAIKPEFWRSDDITALSREQRLLFIGLWSYVDDNGVGVDDYRSIAADLFALEDDQKEVRDYVRETLAILARALLIARYEIDGKRYLFITGWDRHQRVDRPNKARLPRPPEDYTPPTSDDPPPRGRSDTDSRQSRDTFATVSPPGTGEQGNRGTTTSVTAPAATKTVDRFDEFWKLYPRKVDKQEARKVWQAILKRKVDPDQVIAALRRQVGTWQAEGKETKFVPHPPVWLRRSRWEDEPEPARLTLVPDLATPSDPVLAFDELRRRGDARACARLLDVPWIEPSQRPSDLTPPQEWLHARRVEWIDAHAEVLRAALTGRQTG